MLSPLLFSLFVNDLPDVLQRSVPHMYADDTQAYVSAKRDQVSVNGCIGELRSDFDRISEWSKDNELDLNPRKTKVICFSNSNLSAIIPDFVVGGKVIERSDTVENLGLLMSGNMSWRAHCDRVSSRVFAGLRSLWVHGNVTSRVMRINLVKSLLLPHFTYCCEVFAFGLDDLCRRTLKKAFHACVRYAFGLRRRDGVSDFEGRILGCGIFKYIEYRALLFLGKVIRTGSPGYLSEILHSGRSKRTLCIVPASTTVASTYNSLLFKGIHEYNSLPVHVRHAKTVGDFGRLLADSYCRSA